MAGAVGELSMKVDNGISITLTGMGILQVHTPERTVLAVFNGKQLEVLSQALHAKACAPMYGNRVKDFTEELRTTLRYYADRANWTTSLDVRGSKNCLLSDEHGHRHGYERAEKTLEKT